MSSRVTSHAPLLLWAWLSGIQAAIGAMDNADLEKLKITPGKLVPKFKPSVTEYSVTVGSGVGKLKLSPLTSDSGASCNIKASLQLAHANYVQSDYHACPLSVKQTRLLSMISPRLVFAITPVSHSVSYTS